MDKCLRMCIKILYKIETMCIKHFCAILCFSVIMPFSSGDTDDPVSHQNNATMNDVLNYLEDLKTNMNEQFQTLKNGQQILDERIKSFEMFANQSCGTTDDNVRISNNDAGSILKAMEDSLQDIQNVSKLRHKEILSELKKYTEMIDGEEAVDGNSSCISKFKASAHFLNYLLLGTWSSTSTVFLSNDHSLYAPEPRMDVMLDFICMGRVCWEGSVKVSDVQ